MVMKHLISKILFILLLCIVHTATCHADTFKGRIVNAETGEPIVGASVRTEINPQPGWSYQNSTETDSTGCYSINASVEGRILFTFSMIGYKNMRKVDYAYGREVKDTTDFGDIRLHPTALMLQEVVVKSSVPRFTMAGDTIVFNPEAFKLKDGARLDELIKKLPGVQRRDGKLYWNDKPIRLMMNGKDLFGGDAIVGELPADVAKKLKLYDRKSELARKTGNDDGQEDNVLDIQVKPGFLDKWYGEVEAQYQTKDRYMFDVRASKLSDHDPQMVYAQANNTNRYIDRTINQSMNRNIDQDGKSQYGSYNYQHNWQTAGAERLGNNRFDLGASMGHSDGWGTNNTSTETFLPGTEHTMALTRDYNRNHIVTPQLQANLKAYTDSSNFVEANVTAKYERKRTHSQYDAASYGYDAGRYEYNSLDAAMAAKPGDPLYARLIMRNRNYSTTDREKRDLQTTFLWQHFTKNKGSLAIIGYANVQGIDLKGHTTRNTEYLREGTADRLWQLNDNPTRKITTAIDTHFEQWLGSKLYVKLEDRIAYNRNHDSRDIYADTGDRPDNYTPTTPDQANAKNYLLNQWTNTLTANATLRPTKALMIMPKFVWNLTHDDADYRYGRLDTTAVRTSHAYEPSVFLKWKISRVRNMDLSFAYNTTVPEISRTFGFRSTLDPLNIETGNPLLGNTHSHTTTFNYHRMWLRKQIVLGLSASYRKDINPIGTLYTYNPTTGVYESKPVNVRGGQQWRFGLNYDQGLGVYFRLMSKFSLIASRAYGYMTILSTEAAQMPELNRQNNLGVNHNIELSYEAEKVQLTLSNDLQYNRYRYSDASYNNAPLYDKVGLDATLQLAPFEMNFSIADEIRSGYQTASMNRHRLLASAYISYRFCKNKWRVSLYADDIFNKDIYYDVNTSAYQRSESSSEYIHHYLNLTLAYRFDAKSQNKSKNFGH